MAIHPRGRGLTAIQTPRVGVASPAKWACLPRPWGEGACPPPVSPGNAARGRGSPKNNPRALRACVPRHRRRRRHCARLTHGPAPPVFLTAPPRPRSRSRPRPHAPGSRGRRSPERPRRRPRGSRRSREATGTATRPRATSCTGSPSRNPRGTPGTWPRGRGGRPAATRLRGHAVSTGGIPGEGGRGAAPVRVDSPVRLRAGGRCELRCKVSVSGRGLRRVRAGLRCAGASRGSAGSERPCGAPVTRYELRSVRAGLRFSAPKPRRAPASPAPSVPGSGRSVQSPAAPVPALQSCPVQSSRCSGASATSPAKSVPRSPPPSPASSGKSLAGLRHVRCEPR